MIVVGGSYREISLTPEKNILFGSGLKAACALSNMGEKIYFYSAINEEDKVEANAIASSYGIEASFKSRQSPIEFHYFTPLTSPKIYGESKNVKISVKGDSALVFGMLESEPQVTADRIVYDPQKPWGTSFNRDNLISKELAIVLNRHEARELTGIDNPSSAGKEIVKKFNVEVAVIKCGALGAYVTEKEGQVWVGAHPSQAVWPIGSGDIFSAFFSFGWLKQKLSPVEAAKLASLAVSSWTEFPDSLPVTLKSATNHSVSLSNKTPKIYLAGPFFNLGQHWLIQTSVSALKNLGANVFSPLHDVGRGGDEVAKLDLEGLDGCNSVLALLDEVDTGTVFEVGYALAKGIRVIGYSQNPMSNDLKMIRGSGIPIYSDFSTAVYQAIWAGTL